ncbi:PTH2-domain-containing protein [Patellaria atrata CBS 101060]|uniref:peptidyl-tRNA hydrolase n=1 Tax=Patellaria atrata CBS 101060 TaxID=1346257 RepID=A0A9P4VQ89_9PEZI|nr:PTH2-domain-containing protein [Patellaria atrata CBS 101060]
MSSSDRPPPSNLAILFATCLIVGVSSFFLGQATALGVFSGGRVPIQKAKKSKSEDEESDSEAELDQIFDEREELREFPGNSEECKLVLVVRTDLGMTKGKIAAQASHATLACYKTFLRLAPDSPLLKRWERYGQAKVALQVKSEEELEVLHAQAVSLGLCAQVIHDAGRTQIASGSATVLGVGPAPKSIVDKVTATMADVVSIEEANKIRVAMGMKPLPVPGLPSTNDNGPVFKEAKNGDSEDEPASTYITRQAAASDNWQQLQAEAEAKAKRQAQKEAIKKAREAAQRFAKLEGKGLGDVDEGEDMDTRTWLLQQKKRQKKIEKARKLQEALEEQERAAQAEYTAADLAGVKVGHELSQFDEEAGEQILTLKDAAVDASGSEDELENADLRAKEKLVEKLRLKKRKPVYDPNEVDETGEKGLLSHYDEEIEGKKVKRFTLDGQGRGVEEVTPRQQAGSQNSKGISVSLDILKEDIPISDYKDESEIKIRKPKKKKSKFTRKKDFDEDDIFPVVQEEKLDPSAMEVDSVVENSSNGLAKKRNLDAAFIDDDELQANLAAQRREALKKRKKVHPEDLARQLREEASAIPDVMNTTEAADEEPGLVIDETTEFVANLQRRNSPDPRARRSRSAKLEKSQNGKAKGLSPIADEDGDVDMEQSYGAVEDEQDRQERLVRSVSADVPATGLQEEETLDQGLGSTLSLLSKRGLLQTTAGGDINAQFRERQRFLAEKQRREEEAERRARIQREKDRLSGRLDRMSAREREEYARWNNTQRDQMSSRQEAEIFNREYKPNVELKYVDEFGRSMNQKEAFKHLSHQFHGKGSGKQKTEKRLKKIDEEKKRLAASALDNSEATASTATAKKNRQAGVRLQ